ncbi:uncharacterized protein LOC117304873 [Asterias rubens]|uniref:uncharacterized protein LOC117304873 n=1 Tax=Asterias rubens TaxID=7604 RepID=UPI00145565FF|nr:uncharacterized protein LOC117304873 [Asterias rubens]
MTEPVALWRRATGASIKSVTSWRSIKFDLTGKSNLVLRHNMALTIKRVGDAEAGIYACSRLNKPKSLHHVVIRPNIKPMLEIDWDYNGKTMQKLIEDRKEPSEFMFRWDEWSGCTSCGTKGTSASGRRYRMGYAHEMVQTADAYHNGVPYKESLGLWDRRFWDHLKDPIHEDMRVRQKCLPTCRQSNGRKFADQIQSYQKPDCSFTKHVSVDFVRLGSTIRLICDWCAKRYGGIKWFKLNGDLRTRSEITYDWHENESRNRIVLNYDMSLEIRRARATDEGSYTCFDSSVNPAALLYIKLTLASLSSHLLYTKNTRHALHVVDTTKTGKRERLYSGRKRVFTKWSAWGPCSSCGEPGKRARIGTCFILDKYRKQEFIDFPCFRHDNNLKALGWVGMSSSEMRKKGEAYTDEKEIQSCNVPCASLVEYDPFSAVAKEYKAAGKEKDSALEKTKVEQTKVHIYVKDDVTLPCPQATDSDVIEWKNSILTSMPSASSDSNLPRVYVDVQKGSLHISNASLSDSHSYHCSLNGIRVLSTRLLVSKQIVDMQALKESSLYLGKVLFFTTVIFVIITTVRVILKYVLDYMIPSRRI